MSKRRKIVIGIAAVLVALGVIGAVASPTEQEAAVDAETVVDSTDTAGVATTATATTPTTPTTASTTTASTTTAAPIVEGDEFRDWLLAQEPTVLGLAADMAKIAPLVEQGAIERAAQLSSDIGDTWNDLYLAAPETGTPLSDSGNDMMLTCSVAYSMGGEGMLSLDQAMIEEASAGIAECSVLLTETTALL